MVFSKICFSKSVAGVPGLREVDFTYEARVASSSVANAPRMAEFHCLRWGDGRAANDWNSGDANSTLKWKMHLARNALNIRVNHKIVLIFTSLPPEDNHRGHDFSSIELHLCRSIFYTCPSLWGYETNFSNSPPLMTPKDWYLFT